MPFGTNAFFPFLAAIILPLTSTPFLPSVGSIISHIKSPLEICLNKSISLKSTFPDSSSAYNISISRGICSITLPSWPSSLSSPLAAANNLIYSLFSAILCINLSFIPFFIPSCFKKSINNPYSTCFPPPIGGNIIITAISFFFEKYITGLKSREISNAELSSLSDSKISLFLSSILFFAKYFN